MPRPKPSLARVVGVADGDTLTVLDNNKGLIEIKAPYGCFAFDSGVIGG